MPSLLAFVAIRWMLDCSASAQSLDPLLLTENLWTLNQDQFQAATQQLPFAWTSSAKDSARAAQKQLTLFNLPVYEVVARFEANKLKQITAFYFARGDAGNLPKDQFDTLVHNCAEAVSKAAATKFIARGKDPSNAVKADGLQWLGPKASYLLEYSFTKEVRSKGIVFRAEFVRLDISAPEKGTHFVTGSNLNRVKFTGAAHVKRDVATGDVSITDVPMVDQGQKGYCVVASTERVMRYFGNPADANELAQVANTDAAAGTSVSAMVGALKKIATRLRVRVRELEELDVRAILSLIKDYNRAARKQHASELPDPGNAIDIGAVFKAMKFETLKEARTKNRGDVARFQREIQTHIDAGTPLLWCVQLGLKPEPGIPQGAGGHMRLLIGYNNKTNEVFFSDSWGAGHELTRMAVDDAWTITTGVTIIEPL